MEAFFQSFGIEQWLTLVSAALAISSFVLNLRLVARQEKRNAVVMKMAHDSDVIRWSDEVIALLSATQEMLMEKGISYNEAEYRARRSAVRAQLSALIDRGRLFFPNRPDGDYGMDKEEGFRGRRQAVLEELVKVYDLIGGAGGNPGPDAKVSEQLNGHRRRVMAEVFKAVDPVRRGEKMKELT